MTKMSEQEKASLIAYYAESLADLICKSTSYDILCIVGQYEICSDDLRKMAKMSRIVSHTMNKTRRGRRAI